ncbi:MAG: hypothetical protein US50_C0046G0002 [Candidatus Nomurabacteria bacterium GW2011_GWB1_37_5]|uniref:Uncharacterized protein n=1 Tax=Candidatus Nomurabacteria bacterium GW2011_GWB1_37_5 TaxID=1618742 RepID=A0A0G0H7H5_9BACT|nr:MAG: hypothetical protein US50_C0046G0002 [Candidatus Nomurabacteria bacterium GW2011_GWB1_37_5]
MKKENFYLVGRFYHGLARAHEKLTGMWVYVYQDFTVAFPERFNSAGDFNDNGLACVTKSKNNEPPTPKATASQRKEVDIFYINTKGVRQSQSISAKKNFHAEISDN